MICRKLDLLFQQLVCRAHRTTLRQLCEIQSAPLDCLTSSNIAINQAAATDSAVVKAEQALKLAARKAKAADQIAAHN
jgi:hypothetical protein